VVGNEWAVVTPVRQKRRNGRLGVRDTFQRRFVELVPNEKSAEVVELESFRGEMRLAASLADADRGTEITILSRDRPTGIRPEDNELGRKESLEKLAALLE
jgi:hypothetical protein